MRLANRVLLCALAIFVLCAFASAQTLRQENDPRNLSPTVGTGGPVGGPTGLFTIYDGQTLRRGEYTFSIAYSNYDRDPGNVDIVDVPLSFNIGLNDYLELFFKTNGYRGMKVNNPRNLSSFYLPNSQLRFPALGSGPAIVLAPNVSGPSALNTIANTAVFRPAFNQPFVQYPFVGGSAGTFAQGPGVPVSPGTNALFGCPGGVNLPPVLGCFFNLGFRASPNSGTFGPADNFPGIGSTVGGILPGIVLATATLPVTILTLPIEVPVTFTIAPSYLPDAPFINRLYGESSFTDFVVGAKWRWTEPDNPLGVGVIPFYRWYPDKADDSSGFNQLQRGAGPGGDIGDFGLVFFLDGRLSRSVNISVNGGYILNSNPKGNFGGQEGVLLDRPDEFISGIGFDFPINKYFQPILELRSTHYVGGRTPNAFENSPVDALAGVKIYPRRWLGLGLAYRMHINQQDRNQFDGQDFTVPIGQITNVNVPGRGIVVIPTTTRSATTGGFPTNFTPSSDANGFIVQAWIGHRNAREPDVLPNQAPVISSFAASTSSITVPCPPGQVSETCPTTPTTSVGLTTTATDPDGDTLLYTYSTTGGTIRGDGANATWDLSGLAPGTYTAKVEVDDGCGCVSFSSTTVTIAECKDCRDPKVCPQVTVTCSDAVDEGSPATFTANFTQGTPTVSETYNWTVSAGTITSGQGTNSITVDTKGLGGQSVTATVEIGGVDPNCNRTASCTTPVRPPTPGPRKFDEYGNIRFNDEKARLDNYAIQLQNEPGARGVVVGYGSCEGEGLNRANRAKDYLVNTRGIDSGRLDAVDGGCLPELQVQLWLVPSGSSFTSGDATGTVSPCPECKRPTRRRRGREE